MAAERSGEIAAVPNPLGRDFNAHQQALDAMLDLMTGMHASGEHRITLEKQAAAQWPQLTEVVTALARPEVYFDSPEADEVGTSVQKAIEFPDFPEIRAKGSSEEVAAIDVARLITGAVRLVVHAKIMAHLGKVPSKDDIETMMSRITPPTTHDIIVDKMELLSQVLKLGFGQGNIKTLAQQAEEGIKAREEAKQQEATYRRDAQQHVEPALGSFMEDLDAQPGLSLQALSLLTGRTVDELVAHRDEAIENLREVAASLPFDKIQELLGIPTAVLTQFFEGYPQDQRESISTRVFFAVYLVTLLWGVMSPAMIQPENLINWLMYALPIVGGISTVPVIAKSAYDAGVRPSTEGH